MFDIFDIYIRQHNFLVCVDNDSCTMDTMAIKHIQYFGPCMVEEWGLEQWQEPILDRWNEINLYTMTRGVNRFRGLRIALEEIHSRYIPIEGVEELAAWVDKTGELSNVSLEQEIGHGGGVCLQKALHWSQMADQAIAAIPEGMKRPFFGVREGLAAAYTVADVAVLSSVDKDIAAAEWSRYGLTEYVDLLLARDAGTRGHCVAKLLKKGYDSKNVLLVGSTPGDMAVARKNGVRFYPILVHHEAESWNEFREIALDKLISGTYEDYGRKKMAEFCNNLGV